jgi:hypothetical protein
MKCRPVLMPEPVCLRFHRGWIPLAPGAAAFISAQAARTWPDLLSSAVRTLGLRLQKSSDAGTARLRFKHLDGDDLEKADAVFGSEAIPAEPRPEGYFIAAEGEAIVVSARDPRGFFCALQTLRQMAECRADADETTRWIKRATVFDHPHAGIRGLHLYLPAREHVPFFRRLVTGLAALKYNRIYLEVSGMEYKRHPEINQAWLEYARDMDEFPEKAKSYQSAFHTRERPWYRDSIHIENAGGSFLRQEEVRELVSWCRAHLLEVVPEVQSLSHCDYLVIPHPEIAEMPQDPYPDSYCPSNPKSYELLFDVMEEVIDVFEPKLVNIGHDEWYTPGRCPRCRTRDAGELLAEDVTRIHDYLAARGIETEMWGDKLLNAHTPDARGQGGARRVVENYSTSEIYATMPATWGAVSAIPKDVRIGNWYWRLEPGAFDWLAGHNLRRTAYMNFSGVDVKDWEVYSRMETVQGGSLSHWDLVEEDTMAREGILTDIVYSSWPLWNETYTNGSWEHVRDLTLGYMPGFMAFLGGRSLPSLSSRDGERVSIQLRHEIKDRLYMDASAIELRTFTDTVIDHPAAGKYYRGAAVFQVERPQSYRIAVVNERFDSLVFSHAASITLPWRGADHGYRLEDYALGFYTVIYADGASARVDLHYGRNIAHNGAGWGRADTGFSFSAGIELLQAAYYTRPRIKTLNRTDQVTVYDYEWVNPFPEREIRSISLSLACRGVPYSVFVYDVHGIRLAERPT